MGMDLTGASLTTSQVLEISADIEQIGKDIDNTMKSVKSIMDTITGQSEGGLIEQTTTAVQQLNELCLTLVACIMNIGFKIGDYLTAMLNRDQEAAATLRASVEARVYGN